MKLHLFSKNSPKTRVFTEKRSETFYETEIYRNNILWNRVVSKKNEVVSRVPVCFTAKNDWFKLRLKIVISKMDSFFFCVKKFQNLISTLNLTVTIYCLKMKNSFFLKNCWEYGKILAKNFPVSEKMKPTGRLKLKFPKTPYVDDFLEFPV